MDFPAIINWVLAAINAAFLVYAGYQKLKPEVKKMDAEGDLDVLEGAAKSQQMLIDRINELQGQLAAEREVRKLELQQEREARKAELEAEREARQKESDYLRRRLKEAEREARDYRQWAAQLVKQVVQSGQIPAAFIPSSGDTETGISPIKSEQESKK